MQFSTAFFTLFLALVTPALVHAALNLSHIQALVGFPEACTDAYDTPIPECQDDHFNNGPLCSCSSACASALDSITNTIVDACQGTAASPETLIGLFFDHAATDFLCTPPANGGGGGCGTGAPGSSSQQSASSQASSTTMSPSRTTSSTITTQNSSSTHSSQSTTSLVSSTSSKTSTSSIIPTSSSISTTMSTMSGHSSTSSATSRSSSNQPKPTTGGGSPFDISSSGGTRIDVRTQVLPLLLLFSAGIGFMLS